MGTVGADGHGTPTGIGSVLLAVIHVAHVQHDGTIGELDRLGATRDVVLDSLVAVGSWSTWNTVRHLSHRSEAEAERVVGHLAAAVLGDALGEQLTPRVAELLAEQAPA